MALILMVLGHGARRGGERPEPSALELARARWTASCRALHRTTKASREEAKRRVVDAAEALASCRDVTEDERVAATLRAVRELASLGDERAQTLCQSLVDTTRDEHRVAASLLAGDLARRVQEWERALELYAEVVAHPRASALDQDHARWWTARVLEELAQPEQAERMLLRLAREASDPVRRVHAWDRYARSLHARGEVQRAREALARCDAELASFAAERSPIGRRVELALRRMRCRSIVTAGS